MRDEAHRFIHRKFCGRSLTRAGGQWSISAGHTSSCTQLKERGGLSLLEVVLALAILLVSLVALGELVRLGLRNSQQAYDLSRAQLICESKLSEITAGLVPLEPVADVPLGSETLQPDLADWTYTLEIEPTNVPGLLAARLTVTNAAASTDPVSFTLTRWVRDPVLMESLQAEAALLEAATAEEATP